MLEIRNINKQYKTGTFVQEALKDVSLNLRDNEFVSILGPSGSGKTTLLNIIGGLDKYDSGDVIINNVSTKDYKDKDWDSYRSHSIGFIFQSYNLIPHQTILQNVEIALTINSVPQSERRPKAIEALEKVGLKSHMHKKPNQLSGGQMQRVAIARALVNNPSIILADEPTGALDSKTSVQVMELLKEVAQDRLVVMVTHNPELAKEYSSRIIELKDGVLISDSDPFMPKEKSQSQVEKRNFGKVGMSLFTSMRLSFNNLLSKFKRTALVSIAGSIGIIGIALIMAISNGANAYIQSMEEQTLAEYPLTVQKSTFDMTALFGLAQSFTANTNEIDDKIHEQKIIASLFGTIQENNLSALKNHLDNNVPELYDYVNAVEYGYSVTPYIYSTHEGVIRRVSPDGIISATGLSAATSMVAGQTTTFNSLPSDKSLYEEKYEIVAGAWPSNPYEMVVILGPGNVLSDLAIYNLGLKDAAALDSALEAFTSGSSDGLLALEEPGEWAFNEVLGKEFKLVSPASTYVFDEQTGCWIEETDPGKIEENVKNSDTLTVVGVARPTAENTSPTLTPSIYYPYDLIYELINIASESEIVKQQIANPNINVFTGKEFDASDDEFDISKLFNFDEGVFDDIFSFDPNSIDMDMSGFNSINIGDFDLTNYIDVTLLASEFGDITEDVIQKLFEGVKTDITSEKLQAMFEELYLDFLKSTNNDPVMNIENLGPAIEEYFKTEESKKIVKDTLLKYVDDNKNTIIFAEDFSLQASKLITAYIDYTTKNQLDPTDANNIDAFISTPEARQISNDMADIAIKAVKNILESGDVAEEIINNLNNGYNAWAEINNKPIANKITEAFVKYLSSDDAMMIIEKHAAKMIDMETLKANFESVSEEIGNEISATINAQLSAAVNDLAGKLARQIESAIKKAMTSYMEELKGSFDFSTGTLAEIIDANMSIENMKNVLTNMMSSTKQTAESNLKTLGSVSIDNPDFITFYPKNFEAKARVLKVLDDYNETVKNRNEDEDQIVYSDTVGSLMSSVTNIIDIIGYVLIAFVSVALIVSSIMIGIITYISVFERRKEIGILRAMGASKRNITNVFNCETIITGLLAGCIGVVSTWVILIPTNIIVQNLTGETNLRGFLPITTAMILIVLSMILTTIGGLLPSRSAAKQDPVVALRTE